MDTLLTMSEAARYLGCSVSSIRNYTKSKGKYNLPCIRTIGQHRKIRQSDLDAFISKFSDISNKTNILTANEQGFGDDETEQEQTYKSIKFGSDGTSSDELFRQHDEKVNAKGANNAVVQDM